MLHAAAEYDAKKAASELKDYKDKQLKKIEAAKKAAKGVYVVVGFMEPP